MTIKENAEKENRTRPKTRSRRVDNLDLRKKVLKDQTSRILNQSPMREHLRGKSPVKIDFEKSKKEIPCSLIKEQTDGKNDPNKRVGCEEKTLQIQRKLERIIHKKKPESSAVDLLVMVQQMKYTPTIVENTKICYTLEALKLIVQDKTVIEKADETLEFLSKVTKNDGATKPKTELKVNKEKDEDKLHKSDKDNKREKETTRAKPVFEEINKENKKPVEEEKKVEETFKKPEINSYREWRDAKAEEKLKEELLLEQKKKDFEKRMKELKEREAKLKRKEKELERNKEKLQSREERIKNKLHVEEENSKEKIQPEETAQEEEIVQETVTDDSSSMRIGFWMDKLLGQVDSLSLLDKKLGNIEQKVKETNVPKEAEKQDKPSSQHSEKKSHFEKPRKEKSDKVKESSNIFEDELLKITQSVQKILITEDSIETVSVQFDKTQIKTVQKDHAVKEKQPVKKSSKLCEETVELIISLKTVLDNEASYEVTHILKTLKSLHAIEMSIQTLQTTKIGMTVNNLRKNSENTEVKDFCKKLILSWKKLMPRDSSTVKPEKSEAKDKENSGSITKPEDVREYCRKKLLTALIADIKDEETKIAEKFAQELEEAIFKMFKEANPKYRNQVPTHLFCDKGKSRALNYG